MRIKLIKWLVLAAVFGSFILPGCASRPAKQNAAKKKPRYIYVPQTGSRVGRRVLVNEDGTFSDPGSSVKIANPQSAAELQRKGSVNRGSGSN